MREVADADFDGLKRLVSKFKLALNRVRSGRSLAQHNILSWPELDVGLAEVGLDHLDLFRNMVYANVQIDAAAAREVMTEHRKEAFVGDESVYKTEEWHVLRYYQRLLFLHAVGAMPFLFPPEYPLNTMMPHWIDKSFMFCMDHRGWKIVYDGIRYAIKFQNVTSDAFKRGVVSMPLLTPDYPPQFPPKGPDPRYTFQLTVLPVCKYIYHDM